MSQKSKKEPTPPTLTDAEFEELKGKINTAIHELVFAVKHLEEDQLAEATDCLVAVQVNVDDINQQVNDRLDGREQ